jgi:hypothetical protein
MWELAKNGFAYYLRNLTRVAGLYGTLEGVIVLPSGWSLSVSIILYCDGDRALLIGGTALAAGATRSGRRRSEAAIVSSVST